MDSPASPTEMTFNRVEVWVDPTVGYRNAGWATSNPKAKASWEIRLSMPVVMTDKAHQIQDIPRVLKKRTRKANLQRVSIN